MNRGHWYGPPTTDPPQPPDPPPMAAPIPQMQPMPNHIPDIREMVACRYCGSSGGPDSVGNCRGCGSPWPKAASRSVELPHDLGASHASGGTMNPAIVSGLDLNLNPLECGQPDVLWT